MPAAFPTPAPIHALVPCAGKGVRAGSVEPKQYVVVAGQPVIGHTLAALAAVPRLATILVVLAPDDARGAFLLATLLARIAEPRLAVSRRGGATRALTVAQGLDALRERGAAEGDWVLVHDAARCLVRPAWIDRLIEACADDAVGGLLALPVADTLKAGRGGRVAATLERRDAWQAQTPQMFRLGALAAALQKAGSEASDESAAMEAVGQAPLLVPGELENFKLTQPADFAIAERLLSSRDGDDRRAAA